MDLNANKGKWRAKDYNIRQKGLPFTKKSSGTAKTLSKFFNGHLKELSYYKILEKNKSSKR